MVKWFPLLLLADRLVCLKCWDDAVGSLFLFLDWPRGAVCWCALRESSNGEPKALTCGDLLLKISSTSDSVFLGIFNSLILVRLSWKFSVPVQVPKTS